MFSGLFRQQILEFNGLKWSDFDQVKAIALADQLIKDSMEEFGHEYASKEHASFVELNKYWYVHSEGVRRENTFDYKQQVQGAKNDEKTIKEGLQSIMGSVSSMTAGSVSPSKVFLAARRLLSGASCSRCGG